MDRVVKKMSGFNFERRAKWENYRTDNKILEPFAPN